jgi:hypothetical protein
VPGRCAHQCRSRAHRRAAVSRATPAVPAAHTGLGRGRSDGRSGRGACKLGTN